MAEEHYSTDGPICPYCGFKHTPDEPEYFDESATTFECGGCDKTFKVKIYISTSWTTSAIPEAPDKDGHANDPG